jgi:hypothetical protein
MISNNMETLINSFTQSDKENLEVTLEQLVTAIECWNYTMAGKKTNGTFSASMQDIITGSALFAKFDTKWEMITNGPMKGSRFVRTQHGFVVNNPKPSNEISLLQEGTAKMLGII